MTTIKINGFEIVGSFEFTGLFADGGEANYASFNSAAKAENDFDNDFYIEIPDKLIDVTAVEDSNGITFAITERTK